MVSAEMQKCEYIWPDGFEGSESKGMVFNEMRSKTKVLPKAITSGNPKDFPDWSFDGSSTGQAEGNNSDCILDPVAVYPDPIRGAPHVLIMCQVFPYLAHYVLPFLVSAKSTPLAVHAPL
jgi:glutamine synthetase